MTSRGKGSPVSWDGEGRGGRRGGGKVPLSRRALLDRKVPLGRRVVF